MNWQEGGSVLFLEVESEQRNIQNRQQTGHTATAPELYFLRGFYGLSSNFSNHRLRHSQLLPSAICHDLTESCVEPSGLKTSPVRYSSSRAAPYQRTVISTPAPQRKYTHPRFRERIPADRIIHSSTKTATQCQHHHRRSV